MAKGPCYIIIISWVSIRESREDVRRLNALQRSNKENMRQYRHRPLSVEVDLSEVMNLPIIKITEKVHAITFAHNGGFTSPFILPTL